MNTRGPDDTTQKRVQWIIRANEVYYGNTVCTGHAEDTPGVSPIRRSSEGWNCGVPPERASEYVYVDWKALCPISASEVASLRQVEAGELGAEQGPSADALHGRAHPERAREVRVALQEPIRDGRHGRVGQLPARLRAARSDGAPLQPGHRDRGEGSGVSLMYSRVSLRGDGVSFDKVPPFKLL